MIVEALDVEFTATVAHSREACPGEARLGYKLSRGKLSLVTGCTHEGCKPIVISIQQTAATP